MRNRKLEKCNIQLNAGGLYQTGHIPTVRHDGFVHRIIGLIEFDLECHGDGM